MTLISKVVEWASATAIVLLACVAFFASVPRAEATPITPSRFECSSTNGCGCVKDANDPDAPWECGSQTEPRCATECKCAITPQGLHCILNPAI